MQSSNCDIYDIIKKKLVLLLDEIRPLLKHKDLKEQNGELRQRMEKLIERKLSQAHTLIKDLENESFQASMAARPRMNREIKKLKLEYDSLERSIVTRQQLYVRQSASYGRAAPSSGQHTNINSSETVNEKSPLLRSERSLHHATAGVHRSNEIASQSEDIGNQILSSLDGQREQLLHTRDKMDEIDSVLEKRSTRLLSSINRYLISNRIFLICIIILELVGIGLITYFRFFS